jgi:hypothetical protein
MASGSVLSFGLGSSSQSFTVSVSGDRMAAVNQMLCVFNGTTMTVYDSRRWYFESISPSGPFPLQGTAVYAIFNGNPPPTLLTIEIVGSAGTTLITSANFGYSTLSGPRLQLNFNFPAGYGSGNSIRLINDGNPGARFTGLNYMAPVLRNFPARRLVTFGNAPGTYDRLYFSVDNCAAGNTKLIASNLLDATDRYEMNIAVDADGTCFNRQIQFLGRKGSTYNFTVAVGNQASQPVTYYNSAPVPPAPSFTLYGLDDQPVSILHPNSTVLSDFQGVVKTVPKNGLLDMNPNPPRYTPNPNFNGIDTFTYVLLGDNGDESAPATITLSISPVNDPPVLNATVEAFITSSTDLTPVTLTVFDVDEVSHLDFFVEGAPASRGQWFTDAAGTQSINNAASFRLPMVPQTPVNLYVRHDGLGGKYPYTTFTLRAIDSLGTSSTNNMVIKINVQCPTGESNNVWSTQGDLCAKCPDGAFCYPDGSKQPENLAGYYPLGDGVFIKCYPGDACPRNLNASGFAQCSSGYQGTRCGDCAKLYYRFGETCVKCPDNTLNSIGVTVLVLVVVGVLMYIVQLLRKVDVGFINILITYIQTLAILQAFKLNWPVNVQGMFNVFSTLNLNLDITSPECFVGDSSSTYEMKFIGTLVLPLVVLVIGWMGIGMSSWRHKKPRPDDPNVTQTRRPMFSTMDEPHHAPVSVDDEGENQSDLAAFAGAYMLGMKLMYLSLAQRTLELFNCTYDGSKHWYFGPEPGRKCYDVWWYNLLGLSIFSIIVYVVGVPVLNAWLEYRRMQIVEKRYQDRKPHEHFIVAMTYRRKQEFRPGFRYWDTIILIRKFLIVVTQLFFTAYIGVQACCLVLIFFISTTLHKDRLPYAIPTLNRLETTVLISCVLILTAGIMFKMGEFSSNGMTILGVLVILVVCSCTAYIMYMLLVHFRFAFGSFIAKRRANKMAVTHTAPNDDF